MKRLLALALVFSPSAFAQTESPPNEPPYTSLEEEFDQATPKNGETMELKAGEGEPGLPPAAQESAELPPVDPPPPVSVETPPVLEEEPAVVAAEPSKVPERTTTENVIDEPMVETDPSGGGRTYIRHPMAKKGLRLIDRDGSYYYTPTRYTIKEQSTTFRIGAVQPPPGIEAADGTTYEGMYGSGNPMVAMFDYEWMPLRGFGALGVQLGVGLLTAQGNGRFACIENTTCITASEPTAVPLEKYTFYAFPLSAGGIYRFEYSDRQWVAPYIAGGLSYFALLEMRDDGKTPNAVGTPTFYGAGGLMVNLSAIDRETGFSLDSEYGISVLWLTFEARQIQSTNQDLDFSGTMLSFGFSADY